MRLPCQPSSVLRPQLQLPPIASDIARSLRGIGYSPKSAVADLVDNSIAAGASNVRSIFEWGEVPRVIVVDDGSGMSAEALVAAMRLGTDPRLPRRTGDLGRFGLGLKTASFSQAQAFAVISKTGAGPAHAARWDLNRIDESTTWQLESGTPEELGVTSDLLFGESGTAVIWENLDLLLGSQPSIDKFYDIAEVVARHLGMTFHRFIESERLSISVNDAIVTAWDPLAIETAIEISEETIQPEGILIRGSIVPPLEALDEAEANRLAGPNDWLEQQGFYIYREDRLITAGGWLGIGKSSRPWRLDKKYNQARLSVDLDNSRDAEWAIDIRKSSATPPDALRNALYVFASRLRRRSVVRSKSAPPTGAQASQADNLPAIWVQRTDSGIAYRLNRRHPLISRVRRSGNDGAALRSLLDVIERTAPLHGVSASAAPIDTVALARRKQQETDLTRLVRTLYTNMRRALGLSQADAEKQLMEHPSLREHEPFLKSLVATLESELNTDL